jgi:hypothetical protein
MSALSIPTYRIYVSENSISTGDRSLPHLFIILLECSQVLTSLGEFTLSDLISPRELAKEPDLTHLFHTLTDIPMNEGTLGVQKIKLVVEAAPGRRDGSCAKPMVVNLVFVCQRDDAHFESMQRLRETFAVSPPGMCEGGSLQTPSLKPVGHQSTNWIVWPVVSWNSYLVLEELTLYSCKKPQFVMSIREQNRIEAAKMVADLGFLPDTKLELSLVQWEEGQSTGNARSADTVHSERLTIV